MKKAKIEAFEGAVAAMWSNATGFDNWRTTPAFFEGMAIAYGLENQSENADICFFLKSLATHRMIIIGLEDMGINVTTNDSAQEAKA